MYILRTLILARNQSVNNRIDLAHSKLATPKNYCHPIGAAAYSAIAFPCDIVRLNYYCIRAGR